MFNFFNHKILLIGVIFLALILRIWQIDKAPVSLFGDELDMGYHAYSLLKTGKDYTGHLFPLHLESLADKKPPLFAYSLIPSVAIFGISPLGVRLPAVFLGTLNIVFLYLIIKLATKNLNLSLISALIMATSPWHIHFSRWGSEQTMMLSFFLAGVYLFLRSLKQNKWLIASVFLLGLTLWTYHAAKLFLPLALLGLVIIWYQELKLFSRKILLTAFLTLLFVSLPIVWDTVFKGGAERFSSTSVFQDQIIVSETSGNNLIDNLMQNQPVMFVSKIINNYLESYSPEFLFMKGDPNLRHNLPNHGEFYLFEALFLILGLTFLFTKILNKKFKALIVFWLLVAPLPSIITYNGGTHAIRLFNLLFPLTFLIALGVYYLGSMINPRLKNIYLIFLTVILALNIFLYLHYYFVHYPLVSEKWWQAGYEQAIKTTVEESKNYDKVIISSADEPSLIFFLAWSQYSPKEFQKKYPLIKENISNFSTCSRLDNYCFTETGAGTDLYSLGSKLPKNTLYMATSKEISVDLIKEPWRMPSDLKLVKAIPYLSGTPAFYLFTKH